VDSIDSISIRRGCSHRAASFPRIFARRRKKDPAHAAGSSSKRVEQGEREKLLLVVVVMRPVVMKDSGIGVNNRAGQNRKCKKREQQIAEHLHE
jgi:hypothetical protein